MLRKLELLISKFLSRKLILFGFFKTNSSSKIQLKYSLNFKLSFEHPSLHLNIGIKLQLILAKPF